MAEEEKIDFSREETEQEEMGIEDFAGKNFLKVDGVDNPLVLVVSKIVNNKVTSGKRNDTGASFDIGLKDKHGKVRRIDIHTADSKVYTVGSWEVYFKLFGPKGILLAWAKAHKDSFKGAKVTIVRKFDGRYSSYKPQDYAKIIGKDLKAATQEIDLIKLAMKEKRLYEVTVE